MILSGGEHTRTKTVVTSKVGGLAAFTKKKSKCIGCKAVLEVEGVYVEMFLIKIFIKNNFI